jgi:transposase
MDEHTVNDLARRFSVSVQTIRGWLKKIKAEPSGLTHNGGRGRPQYLYDNTTVQRLVALKGIVTP